MRSIERLAIIGAGTMGGGIAISAVVNGLDVTLIDSTDDALERVRIRVRKYLDRQIEKQKMSEADALAAINRLQVSTSMETASDADLIIEAVFEDLDVKRKVFASLEDIVSSDSYLATNTSALKVGEIAAELRFPGRFCGIHYFSPAEVNPIAEVIRGEKTTEETMAAVMPFLETCRKQPIECLDRSGFALNRFFCPYTNEAVRCLDQGFGTKTQIDEVAKDVFGVTVGPFFVMNIVKPRINLAAVRNLVPLGPFYEPARGLVQCGDADDSWILEPDNPPLSIEMHSRIADRLKAAVFFAVLEELNEDVATSAAIDLGAKKAFTFAKGPTEMMREAGSSEVARLIEQVQPGSAHLREVVFSPD